MRLLIIPEVAEMLRISEPRAYELVRQGLIPHMRLGRQIRVEEGELREFIKSGGQALPGGWRREA